MDLESNYPQVYCHEMVLAIYNWSMTWGTDRIAVGLARDANDGWLEFEVLLDTPDMATVCLVVRFFCGNH